MQTIDTELLSAIKINEGDFKLNFYADGQFIGILPINDQCECEESGVISPKTIFSYSTTINIDTATEENKDLLLLISTTTNVVGEFMFRDIVMFSGVPAPDSNSSNGTVSFQTTRGSYVISGTLVSKTSLLSASQIPPVRNSKNNGGLSFVGSKTALDLIRNVLLKFNRTDATGREIKVYAPLISGNDDNANTEKRWQKANVIGIVNNVGSVQIKVNNKNSLICAELLLSDGVDIKRGPISPLEARYEETAMNFIIRILNQISISVMTNEYGDIVLYNTASIPNYKFSLKYDYDRKDNNTGSWNFSVGQYPLPRTTYLASIAKSPVQELPIEFDIHQTSKSKIVRSELAYTSIDDANPFLHKTITLQNKITNQDIKRHGEDINRTAIARSNQFNVSFPLPFINDSGTIRKISPGHIVDVSYNDKMQTISGEFIVVSMTWSLSKNQIETKLTLRAKDYLNSLDINFSKRQRTPKNVRGNERLWQ